MKLKTLKDLRVEDHVYNDCCSRCLKEEAIKWVKNWYFKIEDIEKSKDKKYLIKDRREDKLRLANRIIAFMEFFNITEEDLTEMKGEELSK